MKLPDQTDASPTLVETNVEEINLLQNVLALVLDEENIYEEEFQTRLGWSRSDASTIASDLAARSTEGSTSTLPMTADRAGILAESMNEVLHGFRVQDFERSVGDRDKAKRLHQELKRIYYALENTSPS